VLRADQPPQPASPSQQARFSWPARREWLLLFAWLLLIEVFDAANDIIRGDLFPPSKDGAVANALQVVHFEAAHGFFAEPRLYDFAQHAHTFLSLSMSSSLLIAAANNAYAFLHYLVPVMVAVWVFVAYRDHFPLLRNLLIVAGLVALLGYFVYPLAPPRLTSGIVYGGHPFRFRNTMPYPTGGPRINGHPIGFNPYAAMPSLHIAWAGIVAGTAILLSRNFAISVLAALYPGLMTLAIVVTANHYIMDAAGGLLDAAVALPIALALTRALDRRRQS
jgi:hypothetical protein